MSDWIQNQFVSDNNGNNQYFYFDENGLLVMTESYLKSRGFCCGNKCKHCPYIPKHKKGSKKINE